MYRHGNSQVAIDLAEQSHRDAQDVEFDRVRVVDLFEFTGEFFFIAHGHAIGLQRVEAIDEILALGVTETRLANILRLRYGTQILAQKELRDAVHPPYHSSHAGPGRRGGTRRREAITHEGRTNLLIQSIP